MEQQFIVIIEPKRGYRERISIVFQVVSAKNKSEAIKKSVFYNNEEPLYYKRPVARHLIVGHTYAV